MPRVIKLASLDFDGVTYRFPPGSITYAADEEGNGTIVWFGNGDDRDCFLVRETPEEIDALVEGPL